MAFTKMSYTIQQSVQIVGIDFIKMDINIIVLQTKKKTLDKQLKDLHELV